MVREVLRNQQEPLYHQHAHGAVHDHAHEFGARVEVPVPVGYVKETHLHQHTVLVPEQTHAAWYASIPLLGFVAKYFIPLLLGAILLGTTLYLLRRFAGRAQDIAPRVRAKAYQVREKAREEINERLPAMREKAREKLEETKEFVKEKTSGVRRRLEVDTEQRAERQATLQETIETTHVIADSNREEQLRQRIKYAEGDIAKVELAKHQAGPESAIIEDQVHVMGSRGLVQARISDAERLIGATEAEKHHRGVEVAEEENRLHTIPDQVEVEYNGIETRSRAVKVPKKIITKTTEVEIKETNKPVKKAKQTEIFEQGERVFKSVAVNDTD